MKAEEMVCGRVYRIKTMFEWIIRFRWINGSTVEGSSYLCISEGNEGFGFSYNNAVCSHVSVQEATLQEEQWLKACEKEGTYIPWSVVNVTNDNYQIY